MSNKPFLIGICGGSGSGKTTFIDTLRKDFSERKVSLISQDDYYLPKDQQVRDENGTINFDLPSCIDSDAFYNDLKKLLGGSTVQKEEYTFNNKSKTPTIKTFYPTEIILVEGLFIFHFPEIAKLLDLKIFLDAKENLKLIRRIKRDRIERNYPLDDVLYRYEHHVLPSFDQYLKPYKDSCDLIINNNTNFNAGLGVIRGFLSSKLSELEK